MNANHPSRQKMMLVPVTDTQGYCPIRSTITVFKDDTQYREGVSARDIAMNTGVQLQELAHKLRYIVGAANQCTRDMDALGHALKRGDFDTEVEFATQTVAETVLACDLASMRAAICSAATQGADVAGAYRMFNRSYIDKVRNLGTWVAPDLYPFTHHGRTA